MNLMDYLQPAKDTLLAKWEEFQESTVYSQFKERYDSLSPVGQKSIAVFFVLFFVFIIYQIPYAFLSSAEDSIDVFNERKTQVAEMLDITQQSKSLPPLPKQMDLEELKSTVSGKLSESNLLPEQIKDVSETTAGEGSAALVPNSVIQNSINVKIEKINLKQVVDIEFQLTKISPLVKILSVDVAANATDNHYYDVKYLIASFSVKEVEKEIVDEKKPKVRPSQKNKKKDEELPPEGEL